MKSVQVAELKNHLSAHLRAVERGERIEVRDRRRPIAAIVPIGSASPAVQIRPAQIALSDVRIRARPARWAMGSLELLLEERGER